jgi:hypothetical protein
MTDNTARTTMIFPPSPLVADLANIPVLTFDPQLISLLANFGCPQDDTANGIIMLRVQDCADAAIDDTANTTLSVKQGGNEVQGTSVLDLSQLQQSAAGTYMICNVPENAVTTVGASYSGKTLRAHDVKVVKGASTATIVRPGY